MKETSGHTARSKPSLGWTWLISLPMMTILVSLAGLAQEVPDVDPQAKQILRQMSDFLSSASQFSFRAEVTEEEVFESGSKIQVNSLVEIAMKRPGRFWADVRDEHNHRRVFYDGTSITVQTVPANVYATAPAPAQIDATLDLVADEYGVTVPMADLLYSNPYEILVEQIDGALYAGKHRVNGEPLHHLAFTQENIDWQIWVEDGRRMVPRKFVITYKNEPGAPQYTAFLSDWDFSPHLPEQLFQFDKPLEASQIDFLTPSDIE